MPCPGRSDPEKCPDGAKLLQEVERTYWAHVDAQEQAKKNPHKYNLQVAAEADAARLKARKKWRAHRLECDRGEEYPDTIHTKGGSVHRVRIGELPPREEEHDAPE